MTFRNFKLYLKNIYKAFFKKIQKDEIFVFAQALTYTTLLTLIPVLGLIVSIAKSFIPQQKIIDEIFMNFTKYLTPQATSKIIKVITQLIDKLETFPLGKFSIIAYFFMSIGLLFQIEDALNKIFQSSKRRTFIQRITFYWLCMTLTPFLFLLPVIFHSYFGNLFTTSSVLLITVLFYLMYVYFPARKVSKKEALIGAVFSTILWVLTSYLFGLYVKYAVSLSKIYGSLIAFPLFLIWIFTNWLVFLIGAEIVILLEQKNWKSPVDYIPPVWLKLYLLFIIGKAFKNEKVLNLNQLSQILNLPPSILEPPLEELEREGFISLAEENIFLTKPPEKIKISRLLKLDSYEILRVEELNLLYEKIKKYSQPFSGLTLEHLLN